MKKRRLLDPQKKIVTDLLRERREDLNMTIPAELKLEMSEAEDQKDKKVMSITNVTDSIESVVKASSDVKKQEVTKVVTGNFIVQVNKEICEDEFLVNSSSDGESSHDNRVTAPKGDVKLPENLPADILSCISSIKEAGQKNDFKFTSSEINPLILRYFGRFFKTFID